MTKLEAFKKALGIYGSQAAMAKSLGVDQTTISKRLQSSKEVGAEWVLTIEVDTGVSRHDLRPDIYPRPLNFPNQVSDMDCGEYGNRLPVLDKQMAGAA
ncbi:MAG: hypothetical protein FD163_2513 [Hyphomonadaceae bacterium]|nr:MAG: hypothetical protein FD128_1591 [Hyphomonadaceae bacterium]KAF0182723.1 MAG: hypothetical protein FD163_2513 [Hyphomonadaceae bacterium]